MGDKWRHVGTGENIGGMTLNLFTFGLLGSKECVQNGETGEYRTVYRAHGQSGGEAIERGQFVDKEPRYREAPKPSVGLGGGGGGGGPISVGEFPGNWLLGFIILLPLAILIFFFASILIWFGLFAMCFVLIFIKPLRGILGFGIAALSLYLVVRIGMEGGNEPSNIPVWIACATLIWLAPLMALAKKPLHVLLAFVCFGSVASLVFLGVPYLNERYPGLTFDGFDGVFGALGVMLAGVVLLIIGIAIPIYLMIEAFAEGADMYSPFE